jgi:hypothetical protein
MSRVTYYYSNWASGELSPIVLGRSDSEVFRNGARTIDNFLLNTQGHLERRPGTKYLNVATDLLKPKLITFKHSSGSNYILEFSNLKFRVYKDGVLLGAPYEVTTPYSTSDLVNIDFDQSGDIMYLVHPDYAPRQLSRTGDTSWTITEVDFDCAPMYPVDDATYGRTEDLGNTGVQISSISANTLGASATLVVSSSLFAAADVGKFMRIKNFTADPDSEANATISTTQTTEDVKTTDGASSSGYSSSPTLYINQPDVFVKLPKVTTSTRTTPYSTIVTTTTRTYTGVTGSSSVGNPENSVSGTTYTGSVITTESVTVTGNETESWGLVKITGYTNATTVTVEIIRPLSSTNFHSSQQWQMSRFGPNTGYPSKVAFHEGRCFFANVGTEPNLLIGSKSNDITDFENGEGDEGTLTAASALDFKLTEVNTIQWLSPSQRLIIGATNGVYSISGTNQLGINPLNPPIFRRIAETPCSNVRPLFMQGTTFYTHSDSKRVGGIIFRQGEFSGFDYRDMTLLSEHLFKDGGIDDWCIQEDHIWAITTDGQVRTLTYNEELDIRGWSRHTFNNATVNAIAAINDMDIYFAIGRTINGAGVQYIEQLNEKTRYLNKEDMVHVDCSFTYDSTATSTITGLNHLEGETIDILTDGAAHPQVEVSGGSVNLTSDGSVVQLGIPFESVLHTTAMPIGNRRGSNESRKISSHEVGLKVYNTNGARVLVGSSSENEVLFNENQVYGEGPDLKTNMIVDGLVSNDVFDLEVIVKSSRALPITLLGVAVDAEVSEV